MVSAVEDASAHPGAIPLVPTLEQHAWGKRGASSLAARLYFQPGRGGPHARAVYSEACVGTHASAPARVARGGSTGGAGAGAAGAQFDAGLTLLDVVRSEVIEVDAARVAHFARLHAAGLPFLLKFVSVGGAQPVHVHPDAAGAQRLHKTRPELYPDDAGRAEMALAVSPAAMLFGFRAAADVVRELARVPEFADAAGRPATDAFVRTVKTARAGPDALRVLFASFMGCDPARMAACLAAAVERLARMPEGSLTPDDRLLLTLHEAFPEDPMCFAVYFLNHVQIEPGAAVFIHPNEPHAYLSGDIIEVSSCSNNVVRAGLTSAPLDKEEFVGLMTYDDSAVEISKGEKTNEFTTVFVPPVDEFMLYKYDIPSGREHSIDVTLAPTLIVCVSGQGFLSQPEDPSEKLLPFSTGCIYYLKAGIQFVVSSSESLPGIPSSDLLAIRVGINEASSPGSSCVIS